MLYDGIYEQIINKALEAELANSDKFSQTAPIDPAEAPKVLAKYVAEVVEHGLASLKDNGGLDAQLVLANRIISAVTAQTEETDFDALTVAERSEQLIRNC